MSDAILTSQAHSTPPEFNSNSRIICRVCEKQFSQYTCPRCNTRYCSLPCYKSHSLRCTESFMRENVMEELQQTQPNEESKSKMMDILKRFHEEEETDTFDDEDYGSASKSSLSEETVQKILSGAQISFNDLSLEEREHFRRAVASGELSKLIEPWDPWWLKPSAKSIALGLDGTQLIQPLAKQESENDVRDIPPGPETSLPPVSQLTAAEPSPLLAMHLIDIVYTYCFILRIYNGDWRADPLESATLAINISSVLGQNGQPETVLETLSHCLEKACSPAYKHMGGLQFGLRLIDDVIHLLHLGGDALVCLLCDMRKLIQCGEREVKLEKMRKTERVELKRKLKFADRKIYFVMCWVHEQPRESWSSLAAILNTEKALSMEYTDNRQSSSRPREKTERVGKAFIEEV